MMSAIEQAANALREAEAIVVCAGAGIGVDSGLPDFRGDEGFWRAYPPLAARGISFEEAANPRWFATEPDAAWGFYGHRLQLYREATPHAGFDILRKWLDGKTGGGWVFTSNVDGQFQKAGFDESTLVECHGSIHHLQCRVPCSEAIWPADDVALDIDESTFRAEVPLPACPHCAETARPNILMFQDGQWIWDRTYAQEQEFRDWLSMLGGKNLVVIECGAGSAVPTVRRQSEELQSFGATLIRINPREASGPAGTTSIEMGALEALLAIQSTLGG